MAAKKSNLPAVNYAFVRAAVSAMTQRELVVADLTARKEELTANRESKLQAFYEAIAGGYICTMQRGGTHQSFAVLTDKLIASAVADVRKVYEDETLEHLDKVQRTALARGRTYASRYFADAGVEHPFPRAKKGTGKKAAAKAEKPTTGASENKPAKVVATPANVKAPAKPDGAWLFEMGMFLTQRSKGEIAKGDEHARTLLADMEAALSKYKATLTK